MNEVYGTRPLKRFRRTKSQIETLRGSIYEILRGDNPMTVRQVFYQMVVRGEVPKEEAGYKVVQRQLLFMRRYKEIPYDWVADNTRWVRGPRTYSGLEDALASTARTYRRSLWDNQAVYVEVWCEKDALAGVLAEETYPYDVPLMVSRGFASESYLYEAAQAIAASGKPAYIYYFGDHDPSGVKIDPAIRKGLERMADGAEIVFERAAVTVDQIEELGLPTRPTKAGKNNHAKGFRGDSVELDAIPASVLRAMVRERIVSRLDPRALEVTKVAEKSEREILTKMIEDLRRRRKGI